MKRFRTEGQNRLSDKVDEAYVEINLGLRHAAKKGPPTKTYLAHRKAHFDELRDLHAELAAETAVAASGGSEELEEEEEEEEEDDDDDDGAENNGAILAAIADEALAAAGDAASSSSAE